MSDDAFMDGFLMGIAAGRVAMQRMERRAIRAERKLEKLRRKCLKQRWLCEPREPHPFWRWDLALKNHVNWGRNDDARACLAMMRKITLQRHPGEGIPLPRNDVHAGQHYNRGPAWGPGWDQVLASPHGFNRRNP